MGLCSLGALAGAPLMGVEAEGVMGVVGVGGWVSRWTGEVATEGDGLYRTASPKSASRQRPWMEDHAKRTTRQSSSLLIHTMTQD